jgi:O-antigen ligase
MSSHVRLEMLAAGVPKILESPLVGYGPTTGDAQAGFSSRMFGGFVDDYFLALGLRVGLVGLIAYIGLYVAALWRTPKSWYERAPNALGFFLVVAIVGQMLMQIIHALSDLIGLLFALIAMTVVLGEQRRSHTANLDDRV